MPLSALLLDLDGTLLDANATHSEAWLRAARDTGREVDPRTVDRAIGEGGDQFIPDVFGVEADSDEGQAVSDAYDRHIDTLLEERRLGVFTGAERLIEAARERGLKLALATSADTLDALFAAAGTDFRDRVDATTDADDADRSKPAPDVLTAAAEALGLEPAACALVGDTVYDGQAAARAGVAFIGVTTWVWDADALEGSGAVYVAPSTEALADRLDEALKAVRKA